MMKLLHLAALSVVLGAGLVSCSKEPDGVSSALPQEIVLVVDDGSMDMSVDTRTTAVSSVPSTLYWSATTGTAGSMETGKWDSASASVSSGKISTGKYQTATPTSYNYYVSNQAINFALTGSTVTADGTQDVIAGMATSSGGNVSVVLDHVFARTGTLTCNTQEGYEISNISWKIVGSSSGINGTKGTYNIAQGKFTAVSTRLTSAQTITSSSDLYLIPGTYTITVSYTLKLGDYSVSLSKSGDVDLVGGKVNNISCTAVGGEATAMDINVSLSDWGENNVNVNFS